MDITGKQIALVALVFCGGLLWLGRTTPAQVDACVATTGWSAAKCQVELSR